MKWRRSAVAALDCETLCYAASTLGGALVRQAHFLYVDTDSRLRPFARRRLMTARPGGLSCTETMGASTGHITRLKRSSTLSSLHSRVVCADKARRSAAYSHERCGMSSSDDPVFSIGVGSGSMVIELAKTKRNRDDRKRMDRG